MRFVLTTMTSVFLFAAQASAMGGSAPDGAQPAGPMDYLVSFFPFILILGVFYFLMIRPESQKAKKIKELRESIKKGDKVVTIGGIHGAVMNVDKKTVTLKVADNVKMVFNKSAVGGIQSAEEEKGGE